MEGPDFNLEFQPAYGEAVPVAEIERLTDIYAAILAAYFSEPPK